MSKLKIKPEHYDHIKSLMVELGKQIDFAAIKQAYMDAGNSEKRFRWDMMWRLKISSWTCQNLYVYMNDDHIDSALRCIFDELKIS